MARCPALLIRSSAYYLTINDGVHKGLLLVDHIVRTVKVIIAVILRVAHLGIAMAAGLVDVAQLRRDDAVEVGNVV